jgi:glycerate kinase
VRLVIAPDKFKGSLDAPAVCAAISSGWKIADPNAEIDCCPMADGGEGTVAAMVAAGGGRIVRRRVTGPLAEMKVDAAFGILADGKTAVVEMAAASGLALLKPEDQNPQNTTSFGTGELLAAAAEMGVEKIILGIGGSATIDGGIGIAQACGLPVLLNDGELVSQTEPLTGADLEKVVLIKHGRGSKVDRVRIEVASDVTNPLCGPNGAAAIFGPQKGATPEQVRWFDEQLAALARRTGKEDIAQMPGAGAAGGVGFALAAFFGAKLRPGVEIVIEATRLLDRLKGADLCITAEGRLDGQSLGGKTAIGVARLCRSIGVPCIALVGGIGDGAEKAIPQGMTAYFAICDGPMSVEDAMAHTAELLEKTSANIGRLFSSARPVR